MRVPLNCIVHVTYVQTYICNYVTYVLYTTALSIVTRFSLQVETLAACISQSLILLKV